MVISLFVGNLLLFGFQSSKPEVQPEAVAKQVVVEDSSIPTIYLFSEIMENRDLKSGNRQCFSLGPFHSTEEMEDIHADLMEVSVSITERQTQALVEKGYWVFMRPYASLLEANRALLSLQAQGLEDIGIIYDGEWQNAISLGYFLRQENAIRRKEALEDRGFDPLVNVQRHAEPRYWLDYEQDPGSELIALDMQNRPNDFMQRALPCAEQMPPDTVAQDSQAADLEIIEVQAQRIENSASGEGEDTEPDQTPETETDSGSGVETGEG
jgi:hypothetical protein